MQCYFHQAALNEPRVAIYVALGLHTTRQQSYFHTSQYYKGEAYVGVQLPSALPGISTVVVLSAQKQQSKSDNMFLWLTLECSFSFEE